MKTTLKILKWVGIVLVSLAVILVILVYARRDRTFEAEYPNIKASADSAMLERGRYLVNGPAHCTECHGDPTQVEKLLRGEEVPLSGGYEFKLPLGVIRSANITSDPETGIGKLTDGEIARTLRHAVGSDGRAIFDFMPYQNVSDYDLTAIVSYIRTLPPVKHKVERMEFNFFGDAVRAFLIEPAKGDGVPPKLVVPDSTIEYGKYLARNVANCRGCHTDRDMQTGAYIGPDFAGGPEFEGIKNQSVKLYPPNITSDPKTGKLANWTEDFFIQRFRKGRLVPESPMPWSPFSKMSDLELKALFRYLKTVTPVENIAGPKKD
jgi:mono/diheme cytochrome c family protein